MNYLIVVAHPDDEVLGAGATIKKLTKQGHKLSVCILSSEVSARKLRPEINELKNNMNVAMDLLGVNDVILGDFPNIKFNTVAHLELVKFIENAITDTEADIVITHHPSDLNNDHLHTSLACQAAVRLFQRNCNIKPIRELLFMEIPSATEWSLNTSMNSFRPNVFVSVSYGELKSKIDALNQYKGVMREHPHPRSCEGLESLARYRGNQSGLIYAESFESVFRRDV